MGIYYVQLVDVLEDAGVRCRVESVNAGWESRARSSGGFSSAPLGIIDHHTASNTSPQNDLNYMIHNSDDAPIGNMYLDNEGSVWPIAAGASNCAGKGGPYTFSRGTVPLDSGNSRCWNIEAANSGVGEVWSQAQMDAYFKVNIALSKMFGNKVTDVASHQEWAPDRKIDPATAAAVQGPWKPRSINSSGTWNMNDMRDELKRRSGSTTPPPTQPPPSGGTYTVVSGDSWWGISTKLFCTVDQLLAANPPATSSTVIHPGDKLNIPGSTTPPPPDPGDIDWAAEGAKMATPPGSPTLKKGVENDNVPWLQAVLSSMPKTDGSGPIYNPDWVHHDHLGSGAEDSNLFGDATYNSVKYWQGKNGLTADGVYGNQSASKMAAVRGK